MTIWKYELTKKIGNQIIHLPGGAEILSVGSQNDILMIWVDVNPASKHAFYKLFIVETGQNAPEGGKFLGTVLLDNESYVLHVFDMGRA